MPQKKHNNWNYDSVKNYHAKYKDSVLIDMHYSAETGWEKVYVHKDHEDSWKGAQKNNQGLAVNQAQYWITPTFYSIMFAVMIFALVLYRDNNIALKKKRKDKIMSFIKDK
jgi:hypothetical protein